MHFYLALGFIINPMFTDEDQKCMVWSEAIYVMLQSKRFATSYLNKPLNNAKLFQSPSYTLPVESNDQVNEMIEAGIRAGGIEPVASLDEGFMYLRSIEDLDGYLWGIMCLDLDKFRLMRNR